jgi:hypothetical protein
MIYILSIIPCSLIAENKGPYIWPSSRSKNDPVLDKLKKNKITGSHSSCHRQNLFYLFIFYQDQEIQKVWISFLLFLFWWQINFNILIFNKHYTNSLLVNNDPSVLPPYYVSKLLKYAYGIYI